jgi:hypothetical protein
MKSSFNEWKSAENSEISIVITTFQANYYIYDSYILCPISESHAECESIIWLLFASL